MQYTVVKHCTIGRFEVGLVKEQYNKFYYAYRLELSASDDIEIYKSWYFRAEEEEKAQDEYERIVRVLEITMGSEAFEIAC